MRLTILLTTLALLIAAGPAQAEQSPRARAERADQRSLVVGEVRIVFSTGERALIREYYAPRFANLPPGLQKKLARTGTLPPGWQRKMEAFPVELERRLAPLPAGYARGVFEGHAVIYRPGTSVILDAAVLF